MKKSCDVKVAIDERGSLIALDKLKPFELKRLYLIEPTVGQWRGKHYHKLCNQLICVLSGQLNCRLIKNNESLEFSLSAGETFLQKPYQAFTFVSSVENTKMLVLCSEEFDASDYYEVVDEQD